MTDEMDIVGNEVYPLPVLVYGSPACEGTQEVRKRLNELRVSFVEHNVDEESTSARYVEEKNGGRLVTPTIVFGDEDIILSDPNQAELDRALKRAGYPTDRDALDSI